MGFLCCSLSTSTLTAAVFGIILSIYGVSWTGFFLAFFRGDIPINNFTRRFELISNSTIDTTVNKDIITTSLVIHVIWFFASVLLVQGNKKSIMSLMKIWIYVTSIIVITDAAGTAYYIYKAVNALDPPYESQAALLKDIHETAFNPYIIIATLFSKSGTVLLFTLILLMFYVGKHVKEIQKQKEFFLRNPQYLYPSAGPLPSRVGDERRANYSSSESLPPVYTTNNHRERYSDGRERYSDHRERYPDHRERYSGYGYQDWYHQSVYPMVPIGRDSLKKNYGDSLKQNYGIDNFGFSAPEEYDCRMKEPEIDYDSETDHKGNTSRKGSY